MESIQTHTPTLTVADQPSIGSPWIGLSAPMPRRTDNAQPSMQPFVDIYSEILKIHDRLDKIEEMVTPWYVKLWRKIEQWAHGG